MGDTVRGVIRSVEPAGGDYTAVLAADGGDEPWLTVRRADYPAESWPPRAGDVVEVTIPRVVGVVGRHGGAT